VQYAHARLCSIRRKVEEAGLGGGAEPSPASDGEPLHPSEKRLVKRIAELPVVVAEAAERRQPHRIYHYAHELASDANKFYRDCRVTGDGVTPELTARRLRTCDTARSVLALALGLVGVSAPERM